MTAEIAVRSAEPEDRRRIFASTHDLAPAGMSPTRHVASCRRDPRLAGAEWLLAEEDGDVLGSVAVRRVAAGAKVGVLFGLHVVPSRRGAGLGTALLRAATGRLDAEGVALAYLRADAAPSLFRRVGFFELPRVEPLDWAVAMGRVADGSAWPGEVDLDRLDAVAL